MNNIELKRTIRDIILSLPDTRKINDTQTAMRCVLCGDSRKNTNAKRLYLKTDLTNHTEPILYNCFNCMESGVLGSDILSQIGITDIDILSELKACNKKALSDPNVKIKYVNDKTLNVVIPPIAKRDYIIDKIKYLYDRIGYNIPIEDFGNLRLVFSVKDFLKANGFTSNHKQLEYIEKYYIGFLTKQNDYIVFRDITGKQYMRYIKFNILGTIDNSNKFYNISNRIDLFTEDEIDIIISEGTFDIISILYNIYDGDMTNKIFISSCNGSFYAPLKYMIKKGVFGYNVNIKCFQDNDTRINFKEMKRYFKPFINNFDVYYNELYKDFGVPKEQIQMEKILL